MISFLRFVGLLNAAMWFGAAVFFVLGVGPAASSVPMRELIGTNNFPYFSEAIGNIFARRFFVLYACCSAVALLYLIAEWLYFGKYPPKKWLTFVMVLVFLGMVRGYGLQPTLRKLHDVEYGRNSRPEQRETAARSFKTYATISHSIDLILAAALAVYLWKVGNPSDSMRFLGPAKFRS